MHILQMYSMHRWNLNLFSRFLSVSSEFLILQDSRIFMEICWDMRMMMNLFPFKLSLVRFFFVSRNDSDARSSRESLRNTFALSSERIIVIRYKWKVDCEKIYRRVQKDFLDFKLNIEIVSACVLYFRDEDIFTCKKKRKKKMSFLFHGT